MSAAQFSVGESVESVSRLLGGSVSENLRRHAQQTLQHYSLAAVLVLLCLLFRWWVDPVLQNRLPFSFFIVSVVLTAWLCGLGPSLLARALSLRVVFWFFLEPRHQLAPPDGLGLPPEPAWHSTSKSVFRNQSFVNRQREHPNVSNKL